MGGIPTNYKAEVLTVNGSEKTVPGLMAFGSVGVFCEGVFFEGDAPITIPMLMPVAKSSDLEGLIPRVR